MPGYRLEGWQLKEDKFQLERFKCPYCSLTLKNAVLLECGHGLCQSCVEVIMIQESPACPISICGEAFKTDNFSEWGIPDHSIRGMIKNLSVLCQWHHSGCLWEGKLHDYEDHLDRCKFAMQSCKKRVQMATSSPIVPYMLETGRQHNADAKSGIIAIQESPSYDVKAQVIDHHEAFMPDDMQQKVMILNAECGGVSSQECSLALSPIISYVKPKCASSLPSKSELVVSVDSRQSSEISVLNDVVMTLSSNLTNLWQKVSILEKSTTKSAQKITKMEHKQIEVKRQALNSASSDLLSMELDLPFIQNSNYGNLAWRIPEMKKKMKNAFSCKHPLLDSPPFYTSMWGYKMCLRLYLLGDGPGKGTHMSLFFVVMRREFDDFLKWPFEYKVTIKLINHSGSQSIVDTLWPESDKPMSNRNAVCGCPLFLPLKEFTSFVFEDAIDIRCIVDTTFN